MNFSIVSYLDETSTLVVRSLQEQVSKITGSTAALTSWLPHVTVGDGVSVDDIEIAKLSQLFENVASMNASFDLKISGFGGLADRPIGVGERSTPYVLWVDVLLCSELEGLVGALQSVTSQYAQWYKMPEPYTPHITLAFRDLSENGYYAGMEYLANKTLATTSQIDHIALVEKKSDEDREYRRFQLA